MTVIRLEILTVNRRFEMNASTSILANEKYRESFAAQLLEFILQADDEQRKIGAYSQEIRIRILK